MSDTHDLAGPAALEPLQSAQSRWPTLVSGVLSVLLLLGLVRALFSDGLEGLQHAIPTSPLFYIAFFAIYAVQPVSDYIIFKRLWGMPVAGLVPILRKRVANETLLTYSGEAYFYAWARARLNMVTTPFAAIKDVSILSAVVGNVFTLALLAVATPLTYSLLPPDWVKKIAGSTAVIVGISLAILLFRGRLFSLSRAELRWVFGIHLVRTLVYTVLLALCWHFALPMVPLGLWLILVTVRQMVTRLPLVPNADIVFINVAGFILGQDVEVTRLLAITATMTLLCHVVVLAATWLPSLKRGAV